MNLINEYADRKIITIKCVIMETWTRHKLYKNKFCKGACVWRGGGMPDFSEKWNTSVWNLRGSNFSLEVN